MQPIYAKVNEWNVEQKLRDMRDPLQRFLFLEQSTDESDSSIVAFAMFQFSTEMTHDPAIDIPVLYWYHLALIASCSWCGKRDKY
jgi:hypothetical protein